MNHYTLQVASGIPQVDPGGTGRFIRVLLEQAKEYPHVDFKFIHSMDERISLKRALRDLHLLKGAREVFFRMTAGRTPTPRPDDRVLQRADHVLIMHPQTLGYTWCEAFLRKRRKPTWLFVLDASFFCIRSYNHIPGEQSACLRCLGGDFSQATTFNCPDFPCPQPGSVRFLKLLMKCAASGKVRFLSQSANHDALLRQHFGPDAWIKRAGMLADFDLQAERSASASDYTGHVVFHGAQLEPKGARWALEVARACPSVPFLFPFDSVFAAGYGTPPSNAVFHPMTWETGLREAIENSRATLCPSLWSAPVEGALIKSIIHAPVTAVAAEETAFCSTFPDNVLLKLSKDPEQAAAQLLSSPPPSREAILQWCDSYYKSNKNILGNLYAAMGFAGA